jgi:hypothetical protein
MVAMLAIEISLGHTANSLATIAIKLDRGVSLGDELLIEDI